MNHGYARCSTNESKQDIDRQVRELKQAGAEAIFLEYEHGDAAVKCQLSSLLEQAQPGDTIITLEVSRLARSTKQLCEIIEIIKAKHLRLVIVGSITVDCSNGEIDPMTNAFIQMSGVFVSSGSVSDRGWQMPRPREPRSADRRQPQTIFPPCSSAIIPHTKISS